MIGAQEILSEIHVVDTNGRVDWERVNELSAALNILAKSVNALSTAAKVGYTAQKLILGNAFNIHKSNILLRIMQLKGIEEAVVEDPHANRRLEAIDTTKFSGSFF